MTGQEVNAAIRESLGLPPKPEPQPTVPQEGHICDFPIWSYSKKRSTITKLTIAYTYCMSRRNFFGGIQLRVRKWYKRANSLRSNWRCT
jgi:hypothetical protein